MTDHKIKVGIVGISFGMEFIPIYLRHPDVYLSLIHICQVVEVADFLEHIRCG